MDCQPDRNARVFRKLGNKAMAGRTLFCVCCVWTLLITISLSNICRYQCTAVCTGPRLCTQQHFVSSKVGQVVVACVNIGNAVRICHYFNRTSDAKVFAIALSLARKHHVSEKEVYLALLDWLLSTSGCVYIYSQYNYF